MENTLANKQSKQGSHSNNQDVGDEGGMEMGDHGLGLGDDNRVEVVYLGGRQIHSCKAFTPRHINTHRMWRKKQTLGIHLRKGKAKRAMLMTNGWEGPGTAGQEAGSGHQPKSWRHTYSHRQRKG